MTTNHTPGPWLLKPIETAFGRNVKIMTEGGHTVSVCWETGSGDVDANANMIAAAPTMLAALEDALPIINAYRRQSGGDGDIAAMNARYAIAKARGEA